MNTTMKGDILETCIFDLFNSLIEKKEFWGDSRYCKVFRKKGYYSKDREKNIIFDVSVEFQYPDADRYSMVTLIECKNLSRKVSVDDVGEFFNNAQQIAGANSKLVLATTSAFQSGALTYAKSKGIGLLRYFTPSDFKWELHRSPSAGAFTAQNNLDGDIFDGMTSEEFRSTVFDLYMQGPSGLTNSLWDFFESLFLDPQTSQLAKETFRNRKGRPMRIVPFIEHEHIEQHCARVRREVYYIEGEVSLDNICTLEAYRCGLVVNRGNASLNSAQLGKISFDPLEITIFDQALPNFGRERFTLAHELAHHFLLHSKYMAKDSCDESDFVLTRSDISVGLDIARLEHQANLFASCLLMPKLRFISDFREIARWLGIADKGFGELYLDGQQCNYQNYLGVTRELMARYNVSRAAAKIRLESLGLLRDVRSQNEHILKSMRV